jgi:hypothetical protein
MDGVDVPCEPTPWGTLTCGSRLADLKGAPLSPLGCPRSRGFKALSARRRSADAELDETIESTVADTADDPEITLQKKSRNELLRQALAKLSPANEGFSNRCDLWREVVDNQPKTLRPWRADNLFWSECPSLGTLDRGYAPRTLVRTRAQADEGYRDRSYALEAARSTAVRTPLRPRYAPPV